MKENEKKGRIRRIRIESNLEKREKGQKFTKVRGKTEGEIGKVSEKGDTLAIRQTMGD
jgi:hypothetical protein